MVTAELEKIWELPMGVLIPPFGTPLNHIGMVAELVPFPFFPFPFSPPLPSLCLCVPSMFR